MTRLRPITRILLAIATLSMVAGFYLPMWEIQLWAPQYPEGLNMKIWIDHLSGDFEIINGLNHYIGMKHIKEEMFPEFGYMKYALGFLIALGLLPVITGRRGSLQLFVAILITAAMLGLYDFYRWGHDYGHNLDPKAAISVPGMTYDPPILGYKSLLNFVAYSGPDKGGIVLIASGAIACALLAWEAFMARRKSRHGSGGTAIAVLSVAVMLLPGCESGPQPIAYGKDACVSCRMVLADRHYGCQFVSGKGKVFKFDDVNCLAEFMETEPAKSDADGLAFIVDFNDSTRLLDVRDAVFLKHPKLRAPMNSMIAGFPDEHAAEAVSEELGEGGNLLTWDEVGTQTPGDCSCSG
jgi:copper chaperone NosL